MGMASAAQCYQETANKTAAIDGNCNLTYNGGYSFNAGDWNAVANLYDGNYGTSAFSAESIFYVNYSKPSNPLVSAVWQIKTTSTQNFSINTSCLNYSASVVELRIHTSFNSGFTLAACYNGTEWLNQTVANSGFYSIFEEGIYWNTNPAPNVWGDIGSTCNATTNTFFNLILFTSALAVAAFSLMYIKFGTDGFEGIGLKEIFVLGIALTICIVLFQSAAQNLAVGSCT